MYITDISPCGFFRVNIIGSFIFCTHSDDERDRYEKDHRRGKVDDNEVGRVIRYTVLNDTLLQDYVPIPPIDVTTSWRLKVHYTAIHVPRHSSDM